MIKSCLYIAVTSLALMVSQIVMIRPIYATDQKPRVISLDSCADQYILALADEEQIIGLSPDADREFSYYKDRAAALFAKGVPAVKPELEAILANQPDIIIRSWAGGPDLPNRLKHFDIPVISTGYSHQFGDIKDRLTTIASALDQTEKAEKLALMVDKSLDYMAARPMKQEISALYVTPGGITAASGTSIDDLFKLAGVKNQATIPPANGTQKTGWVAFDLETLATNPPDLLVAGFFNLKINENNPWSMMHHPVMRAQFKNIPTVFIGAEYLSCATWYSVKAAQMIHHKAIHLPVNDQTDGGQ